MSEAAEQSQDLRALAEALVLARGELAKAEASANEYAQAVAAGTKTAELARAAEIEAAKATAKARADAAQIALRAAADGTAAARAQAAAAAESAKAVEAATKKQEAAAASLATRLTKLRELTVGATGGEETVEKYKKAKEALQLAGDASLTTGQRVQAAGVAAKFAVAGVGALAGRLVDFANEARHASIELYKYDERVRSLGGAHAAMRAATAGAIDTQTEFNLQFALADRGIEQTTARMATLARTVREYARSRQVSEQEASALVQSALDGDAAAAGRLGVSLAGASTAAERHSQVLAQLAQQQRGSAVAGQTVAESAQQQEQASERAQNQLKVWAGAAIRTALQLDMLETAVNQLASSTVGSTATSEAATAAEADRQRGAARAATAARQAAELERVRAAEQRRSLELTLAVGQAELARAGVSVSALGQSITAEQQYQQALHQSNSLEQLAAESAADYAQRRIAAQQALTAAVQRLNQERNRNDAERRGTAELGILAAQARAHGLQISALVQSVSHQQRYVELRREAAALARREGETLEEFNTRAAGTIQALESERQTLNQAAANAADLRDARAELRDALNERANLGAKVARVEARANDTAVERLRRQIEAQRELNQLAQDGADQAEAAFQQFREQTRERLALDAQKESERMAAENAATLAANALAEENRRGKEEAQRGMDAQAAALARADAFDQRLRDSFGLADEQARTVTQSMADGAKVAYDGFGELASGIASATLAAAQSGEDVGAAVAKQVDQWATAKAVQWGMQALESAAGAGLAYLIRPDAVPGLLASAATYGALALGAGVTAAAIPNAPAASSGAGNGAASNRGPGLAASSRNETGAGTQGPAPVIFNVSGFTSTESAQEGIVRALKEARLRGLIEG